MTAMRTPLSEKVYKCKIVQTHGRPKIEMLQRITTTHPIFEHVMLKHSKQIELKMTM